MNELQKAVSLLIKGEVIILPVEGTYCYVADPFNKTAVDKLIELKNKQTVESDAIIVVGDLEDLHHFVAGFSDEEESKIVNNWPSDKTICFESIQPILNKKLLYKNTKVALRIPSSEYILEVLHAVGQPLASVVIYDGQNPVKDKYGLMGLDNFTLKLPTSLSGKLSEVL